MAKPAGAIFYNVTRKATGEKEVLMVDSQDRWYASGQPWPVWDYGEKVRRIFHIGERRDDIDYEVWLDYPPKEGV